MKNFDGFELVQIKIVAINEKNCICCCQEKHRIETVVEVTGTSERRCIYEKIGSVGDVFKIEWNSLKRNNGI